MELKGKYNIAKIYADTIETGAQEQIIELLNQDFIQGANVRIMPDVHEGAGCVIGFTADMGDKVIPNIVGVDIGCGMLTIKLGPVELDLSNLDDFIQKNIPSGKSTHQEVKVRFDQLKELYCYRDLKNIKRIEKSIGTLGGGNHFIEIGIDSQENKYLILHSGSRNLGLQVATFYQRLAIDLCSGREEYYRKKQAIIDRYTGQDRRQKIKSALPELSKEHPISAPKYPKSLCYLTGEYRKKYLHDMKICQEYAQLNRAVMAEIILQNILGKGLDSFEHFETVHNYISFEDNIIRKGAISARKGEKILIPINMRDGAILAMGKGNPDWNYSAPHGAGRLMSRTVAKDQLTMESFKEAMEGIYTTSVNRATLDESPLAYKPMEEIIRNIGDTAEIIDIIRPIYNFKSNE